jgi:hypothetical protein
VDCCSICKKILSECNAEYAQRREDRESKQEDPKMNFSNQAAKLPPVMRPPTAKTFFGGKSITEVAMAELRKYFESIASFVETADQDAGSLNIFIKTICRFTYRRRQEEKIVVLIRWLG